MDLIPNSWKHLLRAEGSQKSLLKIFCYNNKCTKKVKDFQKLSNRWIYSTLQFNCTKYNKPFKFISWTNFSVKDTMFSALESGVQLLLIGLKIALMDIYFLTLQYIEWETH